MSGRHFLYLALLCLVGPVAVVLLMLPPPPPEAIVRDPSVAAPVRRHAIGARAETPLVRSATTLATGSRRIVMPPPPPRPIDDATDPWTGEELVPEASVGALRHRTVVKLPRQIDTTTDPWDPSRSLVELPQGDVASL